MSEIVWSARGPSRDGCRCDVCDSGSGEVYERMIWKPFMLRCWDHGPGLDGRRASQPRGVADGDAA